MITRTRSVCLGLLTSGACVVALAGSAQAAPSSNSIGTPGKANPAVQPAAKSKCKEYAMYEASRAYSGGLELCKKTGLWSMSGEFTGEAGYYITSGSAIELVETSRYPEVECFFYGTKGKKKILYEGEWECYDYAYEFGWSGQWEAEK